MGSLAARAVFLMLGFGLANCTLAAPADDVKALVEQGRSREAYELATKHPDLLGDPTFDYYYGVAAVDSGHAGEGVIALERYVTRFPANDVARAELARAYYTLGEDLRARQEFEAVLARNPPGEVRATVEKFLDAIRIRESRYRTTTSVFVEAGLGHDTNANGGVGGANITLPVFGNVTVGNAGVKQNANFASLAAGAQVSHPVAPGIAVFGGANFDGKYNDGAASQFDTASYGVAGGFTFAKDKDLWRLTGSAGVVTVDGDRFRTATGVGGEWNHQLDELSVLTPSVQYLRLRYEGANQPRDANLAGAGLNWRRTFIAPMQPVLNLGVSYADERTQTNRPDLGRKFWGARASISISPDPKWGLLAGLSLQESRYQGQDVFLLTTRKDTYAAADFSAIYLWDRNISVRAEALLSRNGSNLQLYEYSRNVFSVKVRYEFK
jgi:hypothetical protein